MSSLDFDAVFKSQAANVPIMDQEAATPLIIRLPNTRKRKHEEGIEPQPKRPRNEQSREERLENRRARSLVDPDFDFNESESANTPSRTTTRRRPRTPKDQDEDFEVTPTRKGSRATGPGSSAVKFKAPKLDDEFCPDSPADVGRSTRHKKRASSLPAEAISGSQTENIVQLMKLDTHSFFKDPVTDEIAPGYSTIITTPMCFNNMKQKCDQMQYSTIEDLAHDFNLICSNCMTFNLPDTIYWKEAKKMQREIIEKSKAQAKFTDQQHEAQFTLPTTPSTPSTRARTRSSGPVPPFDPLESTNIGTVKNEDTSEFLRNREVSPKEEEYRPKPKTRASKLQTKKLQEENDRKQAKEQELARNRELEKIRQAYRETQQKAAALVSSLPPVAYSNNTKSYNMSNFTTYGQGFVPSVQTNFVQFIQPT